MTSCPNHPSLGCHLFPSVHWLLLLSALQLGACAEHPVITETEQCIRDNGTLETSGSTEDVESASQVASESGSHGVFCDPLDFISRACAECIAESNGLEPGLESWWVQPKFATNQNRPAWSVTSHTYESSDGHSSRELIMLIDALSGAVLDTYGLDIQSD
jgi:hypothetical protein